MKARELKALMTYSRKKGFKDDTPASEVIKNWKEYKKGIDLLDEEKMAEKIRKEGMTEENLMILNLKNWLWTMEPETKRPLSIVSDKITKIQD